MAGFGSFFKRHKFFIIFGSIFFFTIPVFKQFAVFSIVGLIIFLTIYLIIHANRDTDFKPKSKSSYFDKNDINHNEDYQQVKKHYNSHKDDLKSCESTLKKIKKYMNNQKIRKEFSSIYNELKKELDKAKNICKKIDSIVNICSSPEWNPINIEKKIETAKIDEPENLNLIENLNTHLKNIHNIRSQENRLRTQITDMRFNFNSIYAKLTIIDINDILKFDEIESEIQKILDHHLKVSNYEEELEKDYF